VWRGAVLALAAIAVACRGPVVTLTADVTVADGLAPRMAPDEVQQLVAERLQRVGRESGRDGALIVIERVDAVVRDAVPAIEPGAAMTDGDESVVWVVRARGTFIATRGLRGTDPPRISDTGYLVIDDATGEILEMGMP
jgi:hypothetical protein